jgi:hypothetical protein
MAAFERVWFISADIDGSGMEGEIRTWASIDFRNA